MKRMLGIYRRSIAYASCEENEWQSLLFAFIGIIIGGIASTLIITSLPVSMKPLEIVRKLGIVSITILDNYPKHQEVINYLVGVISTVFIAVLFWLICNVFASRNSSINKIEKRSEEKYRFKSLKEKEVGIYWKFFDYVLLPSLIVLLTLNRNYFFGCIGPYCLFSEEGQHLGAINSILRGQILFKDTFILYGPLMIYPLVGLMKLFGIKVVMLRVYSYMLNLLAFFIFYFLLKKILRSRFFLILFFFILMLFYFPSFQGPHGYGFRVIIGLSPVFLLLSYFNTKKRYYLCGTGVLASISLFYSQEVGLASIIAVISSLIIDAFKNHKGVTRLSKEVAIFVIGIFIIALPIIIYFASNGALNDFARNLINYPRYVMMGYAARPFPNLLASVKDLIVNPNAQHIRNFARLTTVWYSPILLYICVATYLIIRFITSGWKNRDSVILGVLIFGGLLFRSVLGRSYAGKPLFVIPSVLILVSVYAEDIRFKFKELTKKTGLEQIIYKTLLCSIIVFMIGGLVGFAIWPARDNIKEFINSNLSKIPFNQRSYDSRDMAVIGIERAEGIYVPKKWATTIRDAVNYIKSHTAPTEYIFVLPNEAAYYFLTDRLNPSRFDVSHHAVTAEHRREVVRDIEEKKAKYIIYSTDTPRIDDLDESIQSPEIVEYIQDYYVKEKEFDGTVILRRIN